MCQYEVVTLGNRIRADASFMHAHVAEPSNVIFCSCTLSKCFVPITYILWQVLAKRLFDKHISRVSTIASHSKTDNNFRN